MPEPAEVLRLEAVHKSFGQNQVLAGVDLSLRTGESLAVLGKSGSGKSVLLKIITGLLRPDAGRVFLWEGKTDQLTEEDWLPLRRRLGMVFQSGALFDSMSVFDNIAFPLRERKMQPEHEIRRIVEERLEWVSLSDAGRLAPSELSGGMRRRVALARTLAVDPEFILYDEPTSGLDPITGRRIAQLMRDLDRKLNSTSVLVTHDIDCAHIVSSRWAFLSGGRLVQDGSPDTFFSSPLEEVREFLLAEEKAQKLPERTSVRASTSDPEP
jgi:phospholipid/cholesterol/gamma-HCH transport system ATP-binding protein